MDARETETNFQEVWRLFAETDARLERLFAEAAERSKETDRKIEVKSTLGVDDVREHVKRLGRFRTFFPEYADRKIVGAVAGIVIDEGADRFACQNGLFVIGQSGETVQILNDARFRPRLW